MVLRSAGGWAKRGAGALGRGARTLALNMYRHDCLGLAAQVAFSALFSLFPFLLVLRTVAGYVPALSQVGDWLLSGLGKLISQDSRLYQIVQDYVFSEVEAASIPLLGVGIILLLWSASGGAMTLIKAVNTAYGASETRSWFHRRALAAALAVAGVLFIPAAILLLVFGAWAARVIGEHLGEASLVHGLWVALRWPAAVLLLVAATASFFRLAPNVKQRWYEALPGSFFCVAGTMGVSAGFSWFLSQGVFQVRWLTYGVIGAAMVLLFWAFLMGLIVLAGGEMNAMVHRALGTSVQVARDESGRIAGP